MRVVSMLPLRTVSLYRSTNSPCNVCAYDYALHERDTYAGSDLPGGLPHCSGDATLRRDKDRDRRIRIRSMHAASRHSQLKHAFNSYVGTQYDWRALRERSPQLLRIGLAHMAYALIGMSLILNNNNNSAVLMTVMHKQLSNRIDWHACAPLFP